MRAKRPAFAFDFLFLLRGWTAHGNRQRPAGGLRRREPHGCGDRATWVRALCLRSTASRATERTAASGWAGPRRGLAASCATHPPGHARLLLLLPSATNPIATRAAPLAGTTCYPYGACTVTADAHHLIPASENVRMTTIIAPRVHDIGALEVRRAVPTLQARAAARSCSSTRWARHSCTPAPPSTCARIHISAWPP